MFFGSWSPEGRADFIAGMTRTRPTKFGSHHQLYTRRLHATTGTRNGIACKLVIAGQMASIFCRCCVLFAFIHSIKPLSTMGVARCRFGRCQLHLAQFPFLEANQICVKWIRVFLRMRAGPEDDDKGRFKLCAIDGNCEHIHTQTQSSRIK